ncbi:hypothetical protein QF026_004161 [Streptomyces aurantiacus]|nr:hypothetical protein [Streptomyces aurantiacus]
MKRVGEVRAHLRVGGQEPQVLVEPGGLRVVVAGADVAVAAEGLALLAYDEGQLAVGLEADEAVDDVAARLLQLLGPLDVGLFVEAGLDLDQDQYLLAGFGGLDERVDDRGVAGGPVQGLLDGEDVRVLGRLLQERLDGGREAVVRVVQEDVPFPESGEYVRRGRRLDLREVAVGARDELRELQLGPVEGADAEETGEVQGARQRVHLGLGDLQLPYQQVEYVPVDGLLDLQAHRRSEAAPHQLLLQGLEKVLGVVLLDLQILVAGDTERVVLQDLHAGEELLQVGRDDVLDGDVAVRGGLQEAGEQRRDLDACEVAVAGDRVPHDDREVQGQARDVREGVRRVDREGGQDREDLVAEEREEAGLLLLGQLAPADEVEALLGELGRHVLLVAGGVPGHELPRAGPDHLQHLAGLEARGRAGGHAGGDAPLQAGHPDHEELVQVAGEDRQEFRPFEEGRVRVLGEFEDPFVEREPAALPVEETALRELDAVLHRVLVRVEVGVEVGLQVGDVPRHGVRAVRGDGTDGRLGVLDTRLGIGLAHEPILPCRAGNRRVGAGGRERREEVRAPFSLLTGGLALRRRRGLGRDGVHCPRVASLSESLVTET